MRLVCFPVTINSRIAPDPDESSPTESSLTVITDIENVTVEEHQDSSWTLTHTLVLSIGLVVPSLIILIAVILSRSNKNLFTRFVTIHSSSEDGSEAPQSQTNLAMSNIINADNYPQPISNKALDKLGASMVYLGGERLML